MKAAKSDGGLSRGRMRNSDYGHICWVQPSTTLLMSTSAWRKMSGPLHKDLAKT